MNYEQQSSFMKEIKLYFIRLLEFLSILWVIVSLIILSVFPYIQSSSTNEV